MATLFISDLHLGNPFFDTKRNVTEFLNYVKGTNYSLCINGDGLDIAQPVVNGAEREDRVVPAICGSGLDRHCRA